MRARERVGKRRQQLVRDVQQPSQGRRVLFPPLSRLRKHSQLSEEELEKLGKKDLHDPDHHDGVITDLEPDLLECELKWAFER